jgi:hypothetical protein
MYHYSPYLGVRLRCVGWLGIAMLNVKFIAQEGYRIRHTIQAHRQFPQEGVVELLGCPDLMTESTYALTIH